MTCRDSSQYPKFTRERRETIVRWLECGHFRSTACYRVGLGPDQITRWAKIGEEDLETCERDGLPLNDFAQFYLDVSKAETKTESDKLKEILGSDDTADARWFLERRYPRKWGKMATRVEISGVDGGPIEVNVKDARKSFAKKLFAALGRAGTAPPDPEGGPGAGPEGST